MATDLAQHIQASRLCSTHEHLWPEKEYVENGPDILQAIFDNYVTADLVVAGASQAAVDFLLDKSNPDIAARFAGIQTAWGNCQHTGYGRAVQLIARELYGIEEITAEALDAAQTLHEELRLPGQRLKLLREKAHLDHVQVDDLTWPCPPDPSGPDFFFYDLSWLSFCSGSPDLAAIAGETRVDVVDLKSLEAAMSALFAAHAPNAIAVKSQHAYDRTLQWQPRTRDEAEKALAAYLRDPRSLSKDQRLCLGDYCWVRGVELSTAHGLPFKLHTGYYAGHSRMPIKWTRAGHLTDLLAAYPQARFVLMHTAYPYGDELIALAKHFPNVYVDLCWAWSIDPFSTSHFVRQFIHAVPSNKLFAYGGDSFWPMASVAYAAQARGWLTRTLQAEVDDGLMCEKDAISLATRFMQTNAYECFRVAEKRDVLLQDGG